MKNTETAFYYFKQFAYLLLHIGGNGTRLKYFVFFPCTWRINLLNTSKTKVSFWQFQVTIHRYLNIGRDYEDDYDDGESSN